MSITQLSLKRKLKKKFGFVETKGTKHDPFSLVIDGRKVATTRFSRSGKDINNTILGRIAVQLHVNTSYLREMHDCTKSREDYLKTLGL